MTSIAHLGRKALFTITALLLAAPALAAETFTPPQGCREQVTVQLGNCVVEHSLTCDDLPQGWQRTIYVDGEGPYYDTVIDDETRWIESRDLRSGTWEKLGNRAEDAASVSALLETGRDDYDFTTVDDTGLVRRFVGFDALAGGSTTIGAVTLKNTRFKITATLEDGTELFTREGAQFVWPEQRKFFGGIETFVNADGQTVTSDESPKSFAFPGDKGFGALKPEYGCNAMMTSLGSTQG